MSMSKNVGIIYLVQPVVLIGTNRYKIGYSCQNDLKRVLSYGKGSRYLCIKECCDVCVLEKKIIKSFKEKFTLIAGNEYFEDNESDMIREFENITCDKNSMIKKDKLKNDEIYDKKSTNTCTKHNCLVCKYSIDNDDDLLKHRMTQDHLDRTQKYSASIMEHENIYGEHEKYHDRCDKRDNLKKKIY